MFSRFVLSTVLLVTALAPLEARQVASETLDGVRNFKRLDTTVACAGATDVEAMPVLKQMGYAAVVNVREASEEGVDVAAAMAAAEDVDLNYLHLPINGQAPDPQVVGRFLEEIVKPENQPAFIHCAGGNRAAAMWMIKRLVVDKWEADRAADEAMSLGMRSTSPLRQFAIDYARGRE